MSNEPPVDPTSQASDPSTPASEVHPIQSDGETYRLASPSPMLRDPDGSPVVTPMHSVVTTNDKKAPRRSKAGDYWALWGYNLLVFVTSVCVMTLELTASRLIQKTVGSSLYTWTSVIGVVLAGITLGNFVGGWLADRFHRGRVLAWMYLFGSMTCASVLWLDQLIAPMSRPTSINLQTWILVVVSAMFLLPSLALGAVSPLIASLALSRSSRLGMTVGSVYAWGAFGSIIGTFLTGFYLMDVFGTRTIIGLTSGTLGMLAVIVAGARRVFRTAVVLGWMQLLGWTVLAATSTELSTAAVADAVAAMIGIFQSQPQAVRTRENWLVFGGSLGSKIHELGLLLRLRDDRIGAYYDESGYSTIQVTESQHNGHAVKHLRLDKLIHSYYDPANPTELHYEYEQVYAAVTRRISGRLTQTVTLSTQSLPKELLVSHAFPAETTLDLASGTLSVNIPTPQVFDALFSVAPYAEVWKAIDHLYTETNRPLWGGFSFAIVDPLPEGFALPEDLKGMILLDRSLGRITAYEALSPELRDHLIDGTPLSAWYREVQRARGMSRRATAFFIGGGGFIFPRWFLKEFPGSPRIEVAEIDPAVYRAAIDALGLTQIEQQHILTVIGDARNVVDDQLRENRRLLAGGSSAVRYDFIYGDAFNDFGVPAHLTTREFLTKIHDLLSDDGVFQANIIDIYPRLEVPGATVGIGEAYCEGPLPLGLDGVSWSFKQFDPAGAYYAPLEIRSDGKGKYRLRAMRTITPLEQTRLADAEFAPMRGEKDLESVRQRWSLAINQVAAQTQRKRPFDGTIPAALRSVDQPIDAWRPAPAPWGFVETCHLGNNQFALGFRGVISTDVETELASLDPHNQSWKMTVQSVSRKSRQTGAGRFLGRFAATAAAVFPNIYLFSTASTVPGGARDTFVLVCSLRPLDLRNLKQGGDWQGEWFAAMETFHGKEPVYSGQMSAVLSLAEGKLLTDDFSPVDNLLRPVFAEQN